MRIRFTRDIIYEGRCVRKGDTVEIDRPGKACMLALCSNWAVIAENPAVKSKKKAVPDESL